MDNKISSDLIRGHINTIILRALYDGDKYGLEIIKDIEQRSGGKYEVKQPTLYSSLTRLTKQGYITAYWGDSVSGGRRKYFKLTAEGKEIAELNMSEWEYSRTVIDKLISEKEFDLEKPAPSALDLNILKKSVTATPALSGADNDGTAKNPPQTENSVSSAEKEQGLSLFDKKLMSVKKYENERQNKDRLKTLFERTVQREPYPVIAEEFTPSQAQDGDKPSDTKASELLDFAASRPQSKIDFDDLLEKAEKDGIKLSVCSGNRVNAVRGSFFNKGASLFYSAVLFFVFICAQIFAVDALFGQKLGIAKTDMITAAAVCAVFPLLCGIAALFGYGKNAYREHKHFTYSGAFILSLNLCMVFLALILILKVDLDGGAALLKNAVIPAAFIAQLPVTAFLFKRFQTKN